MMAPSLFWAHLACTVLCLTDLLARAVRIRWYLAGLGTSISLRDAFRSTVWGDAAAGLSPMRFGGELAKFAALLRARVPPTVTLAALGLEAVVTYPFVLLLGAGLAYQFAPDWWMAVRPAVEEGLERRWPVVVAVVAVLIGTALGVWWWRHGAPAAEGADARSALATMPRWPILAGIPLSCFNVVARTLMLPLLALTLPAHPAFGVMAFGSFLLLYSQLVLPTPAGAGAVELGFLAGIAGHLGPGTTSLLVAWRFYTVGVGVLLGVASAVASLGLRPLLRAVAGAVGRARSA
jgi:uncharacterized membrane protein YbhN (UPF0104 family)